MITVKYKKTGDAVYISHIDALRTIIRAIRRAGLSVAYSKGFNPHPELFMSPPLPLFSASLCEYFSADTDEAPERFFEKYLASAPAGIAPTAYFYTPKNPHLAAKITGAEYLLQTRDDFDGSALPELMGRDIISASKRNGTVVNIRPAILSLERADCGGIKAVLEIKARIDLLSDALSELCGIKTLAAVKTVQYVSETQADSFLRALI